MHKDHWPFAIWVTVVLLFQLYAGIAIYNQGKDLVGDDYILEINLKTCAGLLDNGNLTHQSQQSTCAELIRRMIK